MPKKISKRAGKLPIKSNTTSKSTLSEGYLIKESKPLYVPLPGENLLKVLTTHIVHEKEVYNMLVSTKALKELTSEEIKDLRMVFEVFDSNNDGYLAAPELRMAFRSLGFKFNLGQIYDCMTTSSHGVKIIDFNGFLNCVIENQKESHDSFEEIIKGFKYLDIEDTGCITFGNLKTLAVELNLSLNDNQLQKMIEEADVNGDGVVNQEEFVKIMSQTNLFKR